MTTHRSNYRHPHAIKHWPLFSIEGKVLELLKFKNRQMNITNLVLLKNQAVTKVIQMFPPKPRPGGVNAVRTAAGRRFYAECQQNGGGNIWMALVTAWFFISTKLVIFIWRFLICNGSRLKGEIVLRFSICNSLYSYFNWPVIHSANGMIY